MRCQLRKFATTAAAVAPRARSVVAALSQHPLSSRPLLQSGGAAWGVRGAGQPQLRLRSTEAASAAPAATERQVGSPERLAFQAETKQLLNIVANSLYTDKHLFVRELVSNACDALEKARYRQASCEALTEPETPLQVRVTTDEAAGTITFVDTGIGMSRQELIDNLGTIARSGSRAFLAKLKEGGTDAGASIIGQFGVGFYSAFMVADRIQVFTRSAVPGERGAGGGEGPAPPAWCWTSGGDGSYELSPAEGVARGCKIVVHLKDACREFVNPATISDIIKRYNNFANFPVVLNGKQVNTVQAIWSMSKSELTEEAYTEFYKYKTGDFEAPLYRLHFTADAPIALKALLFVGASHEEKYGMGRVKAGVDLFSRKVLIEAGSRIMPDWMRFVQGVVDSEDVPLNISRESMQDTALMKRLRSTLTRRMLRFLEAEARRDPETFNNKFFAEFGNFLKEGAVTDAAYSAEIARLLRFESSVLPAGQLTSFDDYISRMPPGQASVYYLVAPHRGIAERSPYMEAFRRASGDVEVLFLYNTIDDFVMNNLREFGGRPLVTAETAKLDPDLLQGVKADAAPAGAGGGAGPTAGQVVLTDAQVEQLGEWFARVLPKRVGKVRTTNRLKSSPAVVTDHESAALRRMMRLVEQTSGRDSEAVKTEAHVLPKHNLEINPAHPVIIRLFNIRDSSPDLALLVAEQVVDNALVAAGLIDDSRVLLPRLNALLERVMQLPTAYVSADVVEADRFVSEKERDERAGIQEGRDFVAGLEQTIGRAEQQASQAGVQQAEVGAGAPAAAEGEPDFAVRAREWANRPKRGAAGGKGEDA